MLAVADAVEYDQNALTCENAMAFLKLKRTLAGLSGGFVEVEAVVVLEGAAILIGGLGCRQALPANLLPVIFCQRQELVISDTFLEIKQRSS